MSTPTPNQDKNRRVLVIDDHQAIHEDFRKILGAEVNLEFDQAEARLFQEPQPISGSSGFEVDSAFQGREGWEKVQQAVGSGRPYAMAFVDVRMPPGWDGIETTAKLWKADPDLQVVICTAYSDYSVDEMIAELGVSDRLLILKKPFDNIEVLQLANALTEKRSLRQQVRSKLEDLEKTVAQRTRELIESQKMEALGQLAGGIAHDFNNLLTVIHSYGDLMLADKQLPPEHADHLRQILGAADRASDLTRQLLSYGRRQVMRPEDLDLGELVNSLAKMLGRILGEDIALQVDCAEPGLTVRADRAMLGQVILNLATNARDAMPRGGHLTLRTTSVRATPEDLQGKPEVRPGRFACLTAQDTGSGITPEVLPHVFEPFFTTKEVGKGTGLGLATVYGIVRLHQGWIDVQSQPGQGTTFRVFLPATECPLPVARAQPVASRPNQGGNETILFVEDELALRRLGQAILQRQGYRVLVAGSGVEALDVWKEQGSHIDLLATDLVMPDGLTGCELAARLLAQDPNLKVLFMSGYSTELLKSNCLDEPPFHFLAKPYAARALTEAVRCTLDAQPTSPSPQGTSLSDVAWA